MMMTNPIHIFGKQYPRWIAQILSILVVGVTGMSILYLQSRRLSLIEAEESRQRTKDEYLHEESQMQKKLSLVSKNPAFGYDNLVADWTFLNFLQYFGDEKARPQTGYRLAPKFFSVIVDKDPLFLEIYPYLSASVSLFAGRPQQTIQLLDKGIQAIPPSLQPEAYFLWQSKGIDELLFLGQTQAAQRSYEMASSWATRSPDPQISSIAKRLHQTAKFLASNPDSRRARVSSWFDVLTNAIDNSTQQLAVQQITALGGKVSVGKNGALQVQLPKQD